MATLQRLVSKVYESDLEPLSATEIACRNTNAILDADRQQGTQEKHNTTKAASHV